MARKEGILLDKLNAAKLSSKKLLAVLVDPDKEDSERAQFIRQCSSLGADIFLVGGSLLMKDALDACLQTVKNNTDAPVYLFPSSPSQINPRADGILFLSLISGRNPDLLIGKQVEAAPILAQTNLHVMSTGYMLIDCGATTTAHYMSQTPPIPHSKLDIAQATALAGEYLGLSALYMDGGSGAPQSISPEMISAVAHTSQLPLIVGGGIRNGETAEKLCRAGADMVVVGNVLEEDSSLFEDISIAVHTAGSGIQK